MAWKFRKRIKIMPGVTVNLSKSVISTTVGAKGASVNMGKNGAYLHTGIPGTGIYDRQRLDKKVKRENTNSSSEIRLRSPHNNGPVDILLTARMAWYEGDLDMARLWYQKLAYAAEKGDQEITREIAVFAGYDPMYRSTLETIVGALQVEGKPVLQSKFTAQAKKQYGEEGARFIRYVTYFADVRGDLIREKKGRSYLLSLPIDDQLSEEAKYIQSIDDIKFLNTPDDSPLEEPQDKMSFWNWVGLGLLIFIAIKFIFF